MSNLNDLNNFLNEEIEEVPDFEFNDMEDDLFNDEGNIADEQQEEDDLFDDDTNQPVVTKNNISDVASFFEAVNNTIASIISGFTGLDESRYKPAKTQNQILAKTFVKAFPEMKVSPKFALIVVVIVTYGPILGKAANDIKEFKENETSSNVHNIRN